MANAPISIGELDNVPAALSPINSPWAQQVTERIIHRFGTDAERAARYPAPIVGALSLVNTRNLVEYWTGAAWVAVGAGISLVPAYSPPAGGGAGGALTPGQTSRAGRFTIPRATSARVWYSILLTGTSTYAAVITVTVVSPSATVWRTATGGVAGTLVQTAHVNGITIPGLGAGSIVDVNVQNDPASVGHINWFVDPLVHYGRAELDAR